MLVFPNVNLILLPDTATALPEVTALLLYNNVPLFELVNVTVMDSIIYPDLEETVIVPLSV